MLHNTSTEAFTYVIRFAHTHLAFRLPELLSIIELFKRRLCERDGPFVFELLDHGSFTRTTSPFLIIKSNHSDLIPFLLSRSVLIKDIITLWSCAKIPRKNAEQWFMTHESISSTEITGHFLAPLHNLVKTNLSIHLSPSMKQDPFKFMIKAFGVTLTEMQQLALINSFSYLDLQGSVILSAKDIDDLIDPKPNVFSLFIDWGRKEDLLHHAIADPCTVTVYFGLKVSALSLRFTLLPKYSLKTRPYLGTTSMDHELAFLMANMGLVDRGKLFMDPFVGTGSVAIAVAAMGSYMIGMDIDGRQMRGHGKGLKSSFSNRKITKKDLVSNGKSMPIITSNGLMANAQYYDLEDKLKGTLFVGDLAHLPFRKEKEADNHFPLLLDGVVCDPPYGVRAGAKKLGSNGKAKSIPKEWREDTYPATRPYELDDLIKDLLDMSYEMILPNGRLVFWYPIEKTLTSEVCETVDDVKCPYQFVLDDTRFEMIADCPQQLHGMIRHLLTLQRKP